jgi:serine protease
MFNINKRITQKKRMQKNSLLLLLMSLLCSGICAQSDFYYHGNDSIMLHVDSTKCTIEFSGAADESLIASLGYPYTRITYSIYELNGNFETIKNLGLGLFETQKVYHTQDGICLRLKNEIVLRFKPEVALATITAFEQLYGLDLIVDHPGWFRVYATSTPIENAILLNETGLVDFCDPNFIMPLEKCAYHPNDEFYDRQWHLNNTEATIFNDGTDGTANSDINAPEAWELTTGDPDVKIGVLYDIPQSLASLLL